MLATKKRGLQSIEFLQAPIISSSASVVGPLEGKGSWAEDFDWIMEDYLLGEDSWERTETKVLQQVIQIALDKQQLSFADVELFLAGDLLNQIISSNYAARELKIPFLGLYGACSTMAEAISIGSMLIEGGFFTRLVAAAGSHHYTAERQFRYPTEQGVQPAPYSQWTATAAGAVVLEAQGNGPRVTAITIGRIVDMNQKDANNMGAAMAPAAADTINRHFLDLNRDSDYYDLVVTGDLGSVGRDLLEELFVQQGVVPQPNISDCGLLLYDGIPEVNAGGSGCGCSACMLCGPLLKKMNNGDLQRLLFVATGALMSPISTYQGESIPGIAHAVAIEI